MNDARGQQHYPYQQPGPYQQQYPYAPQQPQYQSQNQAQYRATPYQAPRPAGDGRRVCAVVIDAALVFVVAPRVLPHGYDGLVGGRPAFGAMLACVVGVSFANQYLLTLLTRASVGKLLVGIRVVRASDGGRPGPLRTLQRWLAGLCWVPMQPWYWIRDLWRGLSKTPGTPRGTVRDNWEGELYEDVAGLRYVRRRDLVAGREG